MIFQVFLEHYMSILHDISRLFNQVNIIQVKCSCTLTTLTKYLPYGRENLQVTVIHQMAPKSTTCCTKHYTDGWLAIQPPRSNCPWEMVWAKWGCIYLKSKDSNAAVGSKTVQHRRRQTGMTDRETNKLSMQYSKINYIREHIVNLAEMCYW